MIPLFFNCWLDARDGWFVDFRALFGYNQIRKAAFQKILEVIIMSKSISEKIAELRKKCGMTQEQLGERLGISGQAVSKWEKGSAMPDILLLPDLCDALGTTLDGLLRPEAQNNPNAMADFCKYAHEHGRAETVVKAIVQLMQVGKCDDGAGVLITNDGMMAGDDGGMGYVVHSGEFKKSLLSMSQEKIAEFLGLFTSPDTLTVLKLIAAENSATLDEICEKGGMERTNAKAAVLELMERKIIQHGQGKNGRRAYIPDAHMASAMAVLIGCGLAGCGGRGIGCSCLSSSYDF